MKRFRKAVDTVIGFTNSMSRNHTTAYAAQAAYFIILSFIPFMLLLMTSVKYTPLTREEVIQAVMQICPENFDSFIRGIVGEVYEKSLGVVPVSAVMAMWSAGKGIQALTNGFNVFITLLVIVLTPLSFFVAKFISSHSFQMFRRQSEARGAQTALIEEMIGNQKVIQAFGYEEKSSARFSRINEELKEASQHAIFYSSLTNPATRFVNNLIYAAVALTGALLIPQGALTVGGLSVMLAYANQYMKPFNDISSVITELQNALACASRIFSLLEEEPESSDASGALSDVKGNVAIEHVSFRYVPDKPLIEDFNLKAAPGRRIALVGPTGCGKTTFINLLMRFYDVDSGTISVDGKSIRQVSRHALRSSYGMVLQDTWIKSGTVRENIIIGKPEASEEEIIQAAKMSHSWEFIRRLPDGLDTILKEDSLSQGQKQLLCITRVMLCLPPMLILDEATSSIDTRTELMIQKAFDRLMQGRTSFIVAHRLSTIRGADEILVMKDGSIIEQGTHEKLMEKGGFYKTLYNSQFVNTAE